MNEKKLMAISIVLILLTIIILTLAQTIYLKGQKTIDSVNSFEDCQKAGYPIAEIYPEQCFLPDGQSFTREVPGDGVMCTMDAKECPDGSYVGRTGPNCDFSPCPGEVDNVNCPEDIKTCPSGKDVTRIPPRCEFAPCL